MPITSLFKNRNSQAVRIPAELAFGDWNMERVIEREAEELRIRPGQRRMGDVMATLARFSPDYTAEGRASLEEAERGAR